MAFAFWFTNMHTCIHTYIGLKLRKRLHAASDFVLDWDFVLVGFDFGFGFGFFGLFASKKKLFLEKKGNTVSC